MNMFSQTIILLIIMVMLLLATTSVGGMHIRIEFGNFEHLTCYTCQEKQNNEDCNSWAPNIPCPKNHTVCMTVHRFDKNTGNSIQVDKMCSVPEQCTLDHVGCHDNKQNNEIECVSCCSQSFCNVAAPYNDSMSLEMSSSLIGSSGCHVIAPSLKIIYILNWMIFILFTLN